MNCRWNGVQARFAGLLMALALTSPVQAQLVVPAGAELDLGAGSLELGGTDLAVDGVLAAGSSVVAGVGTVRIGGGGVLLAESARFDVLGNWLNLGHFEAGQSSVRLLDTPGSNAELAGASAFHTLEMLGASGKTYRLPAGLTQRVSGLLRIQGSSANPLQLTSTTPGQAAFVDLAASGQQAIAHVGVSDVHATGQWLARGQQNQGGTGNAVRWFGGQPAVAQPVPVTSLPALLALVLLMLGVATRFVRLRRLESAPRRLS